MLTIFLWLVAGLCALSMVTKLKWLATDQLPARKHGEEVVDVFINALLMALALCLLM